MAPNTGFMERSDSFYSFPPASKEHVEINRVKFNYGRSRLPVLFWCTISLKKIQAHNTSQRLYLDYISKGRYAANMQKGISLILFGTKELNFVLIICVFQFAVQIFIQFYSGEGIYILQGCIYPILPVTNTQTS